ncbi:MAG TPA: MFS transporter, partial [Solirubrobacteraceae bacterium]
MTAVSPPAPTAASAPPPAPDALPAPRPARRVVKPEVVLAVAAAGVFMEFVDTTLVTIAFPEIRQAFPEGGTSVLAWVFNAYSIVFAALLVAGGSLADLLGRRRAFRTGLFLFTLASAGCAVAPSVGVLIAARAFQALGGALAVPAAAGLVSQAFPAARRASALAALAAVAAIAAALGPPLGGLLINLVDWRFAFLVNVPVGIVAIFLAGRLLVESRTPGRRAVPDLLGALTLAVAIALLTLGIVESDPWGWGSPAQLAVFAAAVGLAVWFVRRCGWHSSPALDITLYKERTFAAANLGVLVSAIG